MRPQTPLGSTLILPIAADLSDDFLACGINTKKACDHALVVASETPNSFILTPAARKPGRPEDEPTMGEIMQAYLRKEACRHGINIVVRTAVAPWFNTAGEVFAAIEYAEYRHRYQIEYINRFIFTVKDWHAPRVRVIMEELLRRNHTHFRFEVHTHKIGGSHLVPMLKEVPKRIGEVWRIRKDDRYLIKKDWEALP